MLQPIPFVPLFEKFIQHSSTGRRRNKNGTRIQPQSVTNYTYCLKLLQGFELFQEASLVIYQVKGQNKTEQAKLKKHYTKFYRAFTGWMYKQKKCHDNYVGQTIKQLRSFFVWCNEEQGIPTGSFYKTMYVCKDEVPIITLSLEQVHLLLYDTPFEEKLTAALKRTKDIFVLGCIVGLRFSDMMRIKKQNIAIIEGQWYLNMRSQKTATDTMVKLPPAAIHIFQKYQKNKPAYFKPISLNQFNRNLKQLAFLAGWTAPVEQTRTRMGLPVKQSNNITTRFCDCLSSHTMRRTSITSMLSTGMPEHVVKKISGHTNDSKAFYRYVNLAQRLVDKEIDKLHSFL